MRKFVLFAVIIALLASLTATVYAAPPPDGPPGLKRAIEVQEAHTNDLLAIPGVVGTAVGLRADGEPVVKIYTKSAKVSKLPKKLDGVPVLVQVTGKIVALGKPLPVASFTYTCSGYTVDFDASASSGVKLTYDWEFGDGTTGSGVIVSHTYQEAGTYSVTLIVTDKFDVTSLPTSQDVPVPCESVNNPPVASFTYDCLDLTCDFDGSGSYDPDGDVAKWEWEFGDGSIDSGVIVSHAYQEAGTYSVTLTVTDNEGATDTDTQEVTVGSPPSRYPRPADIGTSSGSERLTKVRGVWYCTVGTLGVRLTDGTSVYALSNNHVYAAEGKGEIGDRILQPGRVDMTDQACGSTDEIDDAVIGNLAAYVPIKFRTNARNKVDAAVASTTTDMIGQSTPTATGYGIPSSTIVRASVGLPVQKHGRTTALTTGTVIGINAIILVEYDRGIARFEGQIEVGGSNFSAQGDSGSLIVTSDGFNPVALLFAGGDTSTFGNPIEDVLSELLTQLGVSTLSIDGS
ncbi:PKD domain-containing protein [Chloroflexota bacterium]